MASTPQPEPTLDIREQLARIDRIQAELGKWQVETLRSRAQTAKIEQETRFGPIALVFTGMGAAAAFFAAGIAFAKLFV